LQLCSSRSSRHRPTLESPDFEEKPQSIAASSTRPWTFDLPSMEEMRSNEDWLSAVRDWELFWARHAVWQDFVSYTSRKDAKRRPQHEQWWGLDDQSLMPFVVMKPSKAPELVDFTNVVKGVSSLPGRMHWVHNSLGMLTSSPIQAHNLRTLPLLPLHRP
jgi:hypothetical protein